MFELFLSKLSSIVWQPVFILLLGTGLFLTIRLRGIQFTHLFKGLKLAFSKNHNPDHEGDISHFQALTTALAATIGIGNIAGIATAVTVGGMGALFWLWITTLIGMATKYSEAILAIKYRSQDQRGQMVGGPMLYLQKGLGWKFGATLFAISGALAAFTTGGMVQAQSISSVFLAYIPFPIWLLALVLASLTAAVVLGGVRSIGKVTEVLVPLMALIYIIGSLGVLVTYYTEIPAAVWGIVKAAFNGQAAFGGFAGATVMSALQMGVARGVFSNESGLGTSSIAAAAAKTDHPATQALISMMSAFLSTVVCTFTGLALAVTNVLGLIDSKGIVITSSPLTAIAFDRGYPGGGYIVLLGCLLFGISTIFGWAYYGERCAVYLFGEKSVNPYRLLFTFMIFLGTFVPVTIVWPLADLTNAFMALPNLIGLIFLSKVVQNETLSYHSHVSKLSPLEIES